MGHIRDLPKSRLGVDIENGFTPKYVVARQKSKIVRELREAARKAATIYLATDPDREGEAISWHLAQVTKANEEDYRRIVFHEITKEAIEHALKHPRSIDLKLVNAQQARRILDRLVGYKISPLLWHNVRRGLSAGRVQSATLKIIVDREREIENFSPVEYWTIEAELAKGPHRPERKSFRATLIGLLKGNKLNIPNQKEVDELISIMGEASYSVLKVNNRKLKRQPAPPFITSSLQQEAWRKLHFSAQQTMVVAQQLYEGLPLGNEGNTGLITYMRTDSTHVARQAITETREYISRKYDARFLPPHARSFIGRVKGAQEAHEAIRPTSIRREPAVVKNNLSRHQFQLYDLIWKRMVASQMAALVMDSTTVDIKAKTGPLSPDYLFRATHSLVHFPGFTILYREGKDEKEENDGAGALLPKLTANDKLDLLNLFPEQHYTQPPPRFTEATLIKTLEQWGIGRPSTYAPILSTIQARDYVNKTHGSFKATELGILVNDLVSQYFPDIVAVKFTARLEDELDEIAEDSRDWVNVIQNFYIPFDKRLATATQLMEKIKLADETTSEICPKCGKSLVIKSGRFGKFLACGGFPECKYTKSFQLKIGVSCPECQDGDIIEKRSRKKRTFYGCSNYPKCKFALPSRPLPQPCPKCGSLLTTYRTRWAKCTKCTYKGKLAAGKKET